MALFKCKMCGGTLEINNNETVATCEYCGTGQTLPKLDDEKRANMYDRANHFRRNNEFDKAMGIYEQILNEDKTDAEAYWSLVLCRYGIEYVEDPVSHKRVPTVNRAQFTSIFDDDNYKSALQYADVYQKAVYEEEAKTINEIQKGILAISQKEEPFDVFICYKETDNNGSRTQDSVLANDLYHQLTREGFKVFFARITLEDKLGSAYEPYIFAALNSAKVMVVIGTKPEFFKAVWVRNEWSRYLALIKQGQQKMLIPAYRGMDPYDLPEEFSHLQAQDMSKLGFMQDLIRGIKKIIQIDEPKTTVVQETVVTNVNSNIDPLIKRTFMFLEDGDWNSANEYCEKILDIDPENVYAYIGKLMLDLKVKKRETFKECSKSFEDNSNYQKILRFADNTIREEFAEYLETIRKNIILREAELKMDNDDILSYEKAIELLKTIPGWCDSEQKISKCNERIKKIYCDKYKLAHNEMEHATQKQGYISAAKKFEEISQYKDSEALAKECYEKAEVAENNLKYKMALADLNNGTKEHIEKAIIGFKILNGWNDSEEKITECERKLEEIRKVEEEEEQLRLERIKQAKLRKKKITKRIVLGTVSVVVIAIIAYFVTTLIIIPNTKYNKALDLMKMGKYAEAITAFEAMDGYKDSDDKIEECNVAILDGKYNNAIALMEAGKYAEAIEGFQQLDGYKDSDDKIEECNIAILDGKYNNAIALMDAGKYAEAIEGFQKLDGYKDSDDKIEECNIAILDGKYNDAIALMEAGKYAEAIEGFQQLDGYKDSDEKILECENLILEGIYNKSTELMKSGKYKEAIEGFQKLDGYKDSDDKIDECNIAILDGKYYNAIVLMGAGKYDEAIAAFELLEGYKDSVNKITECEDKILEEKNKILDGKYNEAVALMNSLDYVEAIKKFEALGDYKDSKDKITECNNAISENIYKDAVNLMDVGNYDEAIKKFQQLGNYKDSKDKVIYNSIQIMKQEFRAGKIGDYVVMGSYDQDSNPDTKKQAIEWQILDKQGSKVLVVSRYGMCEDQYDVWARTWEECPLRKWLNNEFYNDSFTELEKKLIPTVTVNAEKNPQYDTDPGNSTQDKVFLLSISDVEKYFKSDSSRICKIMDYYGDYKDVTWWLRNSGERQDEAATVDYNGVIRYDGRDMCEPFSVRPAMWIDVSY